MILAFLSCSNNEEEIEILLQDNSVKCEDSAVYDPTFTGTACCIQRNSDLDINNIVEYEYTTNLENAIYQWEVEYGEIEVVSGMNSNIIKIVLKENFTSARLIGKSSGDTGACSDHIIINRIFN
jgi:hypothetical protein